MTLYPSDLTAIVGIACKFPGADGQEAFWKNRVEGRESIFEVPDARWSDAHYSSGYAVPGRSGSRWCGLVDGVDRFDARFFQISASEARLMDPQQRLLLEESWRCIENAAIPFRELKENVKTGVFVGVMADDYRQRLMDAQADPDAFAALGNYQCILANRISHCLGLSGPSLSINAACASSLFALHLARRARRSGRVACADRTVLCGWRSTRAVPGRQRQKQSRSSAQRGGYRQRAEGRARTETPGTAADDPLRAAESAFRFRIVAVPAVQDARILDGAVAGRYQLLRLRGYERARDRRRCARASDASVPDRTAEIQPPQILARKACGARHGERCAAQLGRRGSRHRRNDSARARSHPVRHRNDARLTRANSASAFSLPPKPSIDGLPKGATA